MKLHFLPTATFFFILIFLMNACTKDGNCSDGIQNNGELGIDCCGECAPCDSLNLDCEYGSGTVTASCFDGIQNGDETGVDCGGSICPPCSNTEDTTSNPIDTTSNPIDTSMVDTLTVIFDQNQVFK